MMTLRFALVFITLALASTSAIADECDARAADLVRKSGATFVRRSTMKIFLKLDGFESLAVNCWPSLGVDIGVNSDLPTDTFFDFVAQATQTVTGLPTSIVKDGAILCHKSALRSKDQMADLDYRGAQFSCEASTGNGGTTSITVFKTQ